jgi:hypothetical protein
VLCKEECGALIIGIVVGGLAYERQWKWQLILVFGYSITGLSVTTVPTIAIAYAVDCYKPIAGETMVVATVLKNTTQRLSWCILPCICAHGQQGVVMQVGVAKGALSEAKEKAWVRTR